MAGEVLTSFTDGTLTITGDAQANDVALRYIAPGEFQLAEAPGTTITGNRSFTGVNNIVVSLNEGNDNVLIAGAFELSGQLKIVGGDGNENVLFAFDRTGSRDVALGSFVADLGGGNDTVSVFRTGHFKVAGEFSAALGDGNNAIEFTNPASIALGQVSVTGGQGDDRFSISATTETIFAKPVKMASFAFDGKAGNNSVKLEGDVYVLGNVTFKGAGGSDTIMIAIAPPTIRGAEIGGTFMADLGDGANSLTFQGDAVWLNGAFLYSGGAGVDTILFQSRHIQVLGLTGISTGNGADIVTFRTKDDVRFRGGFALSTGDGADRVACARVFGSWAWNVNLGEGHDSLTIDNSRFDGAVNVYGMGGSDRILVETLNNKDNIPTLFLNNVFFDLGDGIDVLALGTGGGDFAWFHRNATFLGGAGIDFIFAMSVSGPGNRKVVGFP